MYKSSYLQKSTYNSSNNIGTTSTYRTSNLRRSNYYSTKDQNLHPSTRIDLESAQALASKLFDHYTSSGHFSQSDALKLIKDVKSVTNNSKQEEEDEEEEISNQFLSHHDRDGDGVLSKKDFIECCVQYLCGPGGSGVNLFGKISPKQELIEALYGEVGGDEVENELSKARLIFDKYDLNGDEFLDRSEVRKMIKDTYENLKDNIKLTDEAVDRYFSMIGSQFKDKISREEYEIFILEALRSRNM